jgi:predicted DNA-binding helix-hairpin-helix protein
MKVIEGALKRIEADNFSPKDLMLDIHIIYNDGKDHNLIKRIKLEDLEKLSVALLKEIKANLQKNAVTKDALDVLGSMVVVRLKDEEKTEEKLMHFLEGIKIKAKSMLSDGATPYVKVSDRINKSGVNF